MHGSDSRNLYVLFFARLCSSLSFSVVFSSISLFLTTTIGIDEKHTADLVGTFLALNYILPVIGGYIGSKYFDFKSFYVAGMVIQAIGYFGFTLLNKNITFVALAMLLTGSMINSVGVLMFISHTVGDSHSLRRVAMLWNYVAMNIGFFLGYMLSGIISQDISYKVLFLISGFFPLFAGFLVHHKLKYHSSVTNSHIKFSLSMVVLTLLCALSLRYTLYTRELLLISYIVAFGIIFYFSVKGGTKKVKLKMVALSYYMIISVLFWSIYMLTPTSLMNMIKDYAQVHLSHYSVAPQWLNNIDAIVLILGGAVLARVISYLKTKYNYQVPTSMLFLLGTLCVAIAAFQFSHSIKMYLDAKMPLIFIVSYLAFLSLGELFLGPEGYALPAKYSPPKMQGLLTGCWISTLGFASLISTYIADHLFNKKDNISLSNYADVYHNIGLLFFIFAVVSFFIGFLLEQSIQKARE